MEADWTKMMKGKIIKCLAPALKADKETIPIAVIISGRNYGQFLGDCIESVQRQDPAPAEIIYMDNASEDGSIAVARAKGVDVCVISTQDHNICDLRNRGMLRTTQPYLLFIDADDVIPKGYCKALYDGLCIQTTRHSVYIEAEVMVTTNPISMRKTALPGSRLCAVAPLNRWAGGAICRCSRIGNYGCE